MALDADRKNGPAARSFAADAHDCIMVRIKRPYRITVHRKGRRVMVNPDTDPTEIGRQVIDAVGYRAAQFVDQEVMDPDLFRIALRAILAAWVALHRGDNSDRSDRSRTLPRKRTRTPPDLRSRRRRSPSSRPA